MVEVANTLRPASDIKDSKENGLLTHKTSLVTKIILALWSGISALRIVTANNQGTFKFVGWSLIGVCQTSLGATGNGEQDKEED